MLAVCSPWPSPTLRRSQTYRTSSWASLTAELRNAVGGGAIDQLQKCKKCSRLEREVLQLAHKCLDFQINEGIDVAELETLPDFDKLDKEADRRKYRQMTKQTAEETLRNHMRDGLNDKKRKLRYKEQKRKQQEPSTQSWVGREVMGSQGHSLRAPSS